MYTSRTAAQYQKIYASPDRKVPNTLASVGVMIFGVKYVEFQSGKTQSVFLSIARFDYKRSTIALNDKIQLINPLFCGKYVCEIDHVHA